MKGASENSLMMSMFGTKKENVAGFWGNCIMMSSIICILY
jgi:hypothetical protein